LRKRSNTWAGSERRRSGAVWTFAVLLLAGPIAAADLRQAVQSGNLEAVREEVARGANVNEREGMGATPLHDAAWSGQLEIAAFLIEHGAEVRAKHVEGG